MGQGKRLEDLEFKASLGYTTRDNRSQKRNMEHTNKNYLSTASNYTLATYKQTTNNPETQTKQELK